MWQLGGCSMPQILEAPSKMAQRWHRGTGTGYSCSTKIYKAFNHDTASHWDKQDEPVQKISQVNLKKLNALDRSCVDVPHLTPMQPQLIV